MSWVFIMFIVMAVMSSVRWSSRYWGRARDRWEADSSRQRIKTRDRIEALEAELDAKTETIELLDARVSELESRLDFTERLLARPAPTENALRE